MSNIIEQKEYSDCTKEIEVLRDEHRKIHDAIRQNNTTREGLFSVNRYGIRFHPLASFITMWVVEFFVVVFTIFYATTNPSIVLLLFLFFLDALIALLNLILVYPKVRKIRKIDADNRELEAELSQIEERMKVLKSES